MPLQNPHLAEFLGAVSRHFNPDAPDTFWECEPALRKLLATPVAREVVNEELGKLGEIPDHVGDWSPTELILHRGGGTAMSLSFSGVSKRYLHVLPYHAIYAVLDSEKIVYDRYPLPKGYRNDLFDPNLRLGPAESGVLSRNDVLRIPCGENAFDFKIQKPVMMLKFVTTAILPLEWLFKRETLQAWQANDADLSFTQLRVAADVLGKMAHQSSMKALKLMTGHGHHAVRWSAIQNLGRINRTEAILKLKEAVNDPHPHVRNAAQKTLQKLGS